jgi:cytochrome P450
MRAFPIPRDRPLHPPGAVADLRRSEPVSKVRLWNGDDAWLLTRFEDVRAAFGDDKRLSADATRPGYPHVTAGSAIGRAMLPNFMVMDDPEHRRLRSLFLADFMPKPVEARREVIEQIVARRVDALLAAPQPADLLKEFSRPIPAQVLAAIMGLDAAEGDALLVHVLTILSSEATREQATAANQALIAFLETCIDRKMADPGDDMISRLAAQVKDGALSRTDLLGCIRQLFLAGQDSTLSTITMGVLLLINHPDQLDILRTRDDPALWAAAADEAVRFLSVTHFGRRRVALEDVEIGGQLIRAGEGIILAETYANRDAAMFEDPDTFNVFRANNSKHLGFGFGGHHCLGVHLARAEIRVAFAILFRRIPSLRLAGPPAELVFQDELTVYGLESLPVAWDA